MFTVSQTKNSVIRSEGSIKVLGLCQREEHERLLPLTVTERKRWPYSMTILMTLSGIQSREMLFIA